MDVSWAVPDIGEEETAAVEETVESTWVTMGDKVREFEERLGEYVGVEHAIAVNSGTAALDVALKAVGVGPEDDVLVPAMTYIATANAVRYQHANPVFADIGPTDYNLDPARVHERITADTTALLPIDYGGQCADYDALRTIAEEHDVSLVADCAESFSATYDGERAGSLADVSTTSFHAAKMLTTAEGGMVFTDDGEIARRCRIVRDQGEDPDERYRHVELGHNYRMSDMHAALGLAQLERMDSFIERRERVAAYYDERLCDETDLIRLPADLDGRENSWFLYPIVTENRERVQQYLAEHGIETRVTWPIPVHQQPIYEDEHGQETYGVAERFADGVLSLPMHNRLTMEQAEHVVDTLTDAVDRFVSEPYDLGG